MLSQAVERCAITVNTTLHCPTHSSVSDFLPIRPLAPSNTFCIARKRSVKQNRVVALHSPDFWDENTGKEVCGTGLDLEHIGGLAIQRISILDSFLKEVDAELVATESGRIHVCQTSFPIIYSRFPQQFDLLEKFLGLYFRLCLGPILCLLKAGFGDYVE